MLLVELVGDHDIATSPEVRRALAGARHVPLVVVDFSACTFIDSTVLGVLAGASRRVAEGGGRLVGRNPSGIVAKALAITGLDELLEMTRELDVDVSLPWLPGRSLS
ncbi:MAG: anti-sigma factor antagonist [Frankiales bacterium]|nr:anti-sigma factor antagonist [Frankiales bacterium]